MSLPNQPTEAEIRALRAEIRQQEVPWMPAPPPGVAPNKLLIKMKENPFVPIGCLATLFALSFGLVQFKRGNLARSQFAMRMRVVAQGGTVVALVLGVMVASRKENSRKRTG